MGPGGHWRYLHSWGRTVLVAAYLLLEHVACFLSLLVACVCVWWSLLVVHHSRARGAGVVPVQEGQHPGPSRSPGERAGLTGEHPAEGMRLFRKQQTMMLHGDMSHLSNRLQLLCKCTEVEVLNTGAHTWGAVISGGNLIST